MVDIVFIGLLYEFLIVVIAALLLLLILKKYLIKRHNLTLILFYIFLMWEIAIIFSFLSKVIYLYSGFSYTYDRSVPDPGTPLSWIILRIYEYRISFIFVIIGVLLSYILKVKVFEEDYNKTQRIFVYGYASFTAFFSLVVFQKGNYLFDVILFGLILIFIALIYILFMLNSIKAYRSVDNPSYKKGFLSLSFMALCFTLVFISFLIDRTLIFLGSFGFTFFYFMGWAFVILGFLGAYLGYINPKSKEE